MSRQGRGFDSQLEYLSELANQYNVILVDDASTDGSWERILELSPRLNPKLHLMRMERNGKKVQAIRRAVGTSDADYVLMTDFDSRISNPEAIPLALQKFEENPRLAALSLKLVPEGTTFFSKFQDVEYAISRGIFARYLNGQGSLRCVPGAAGIWDRKVFLKVLKEHSGRHNGDDLESTAIALRRGYDAEYAGDVVVTTIVPQTPAALFAQRRRWELGSLETYDKERSFFSGQVRNLTSRLGHITILDWYAWMTTIMLPVLIINWVINPIVAECVRPLRTLVGVCPKLRGEGRIEEQEGADPRAVLPFLQGPLDDSQNRGRLRLHHWSSIANQTTHALVPQQVPSCSTFPFLPDGNASGTGLSHADGPAHFRPALKSRKKDDSVGFVFCLRVSMRPGARLGLRLASLLVMQKPCKNLFELGNASLQL